MRTFIYALALCFSLSGLASAQGGMMPGPGTVHSTASSSWTLVSTTNCTYATSASTCTTSAINTTGANLLILVYWAGRVSKVLAAQ